MLHFEEVKKKFKKQLYNIDVESILCLPANVYWVNTEGELLGYNIHTAKLFDSNLKDAVGFTYDVIGKNRGWLDGQAYSFQCDDMEVMSIGRPKTGVVEPQLPYPDGTIKHYVTTRSPLYDQNGKISGAFGISFDISNTYNKQKLALINNSQLDTHVLNIINKSYQPNLSKRQTECLHYLVRGMTAKQIAKALNLSNRTIESYLENIKDKFKCDNKSDLIAKAIEMGFGNN